MPTEISSAELRNLTGYSKQRLNQLEKAGVLPKLRRGVYPHPAAVQAIIAHLGDIAAGRGGEDQQADLARERALLARAQREGHELKNKTASGKLLDADLVERKWGDGFSLIRGRCLGLPQELAQRLPHLTRTDVDMIDREIRDMLEDLSEELMNV